MLTQEQLLFLLSLLNEGKLPSELVELLTLDTDNNYLVLNNGLNDAKKIKVPLLRGYKGTYNASTNTPTLTNGVGLDGDMYVVGVAGTRDFGTGTVNLLVDDIVIYLNGKYLKTNGVTTGGLDLQGTYNNSSPKTITVLDVSDGALSIKDSATNSNRDEIIEVLDTSGNIIFYVRRDKTRVEGGLEVGGTLNGAAASFSGNVGIGSSSSIGKLSIVRNGNSSGGNIILGSTTNATNKYSAITSQSYNSSTDTEGFATISTQGISGTNLVSIGGGIGEVDSATQLRFYTSIATGTRTGTERMRIDANGNVGIETDNPSEKLEVNGNVKADKFITGQLEINSDLNATNIVSDDENLYIKSDHTSGNVRLIADAAIYVQTGSNEDLAITASSSSGVGLWHIGSKKIGTTTTGASVTGNLEVSGTVLPETNNVQTITGTTSSATIGANINVVVVETTVNCTLKIAATTNIASIKVINATIASNNVSVSFLAGTGVTISKNILDGGVLLYEFAGILTKIATNNWIASY